MSARNLSPQQFTHEQVAAHVDFAGNDNVLHDVADAVGKPLEDLRFTRGHVPLSRLNTGITLQDYEDSGESGEYVRHLGALSKAGTVHPIILDHRYGVHDGAHRVAGANAHGLTHIEAYIAQR